MSDTPIRTSRLLHLIYWMSHDGPDHLILPWIKTVLDHAIPQQSTYRFKIPDLDISSLYTAKQVPIVRQCQTEYTFVRVPTKSA